MAKPDQDSSWIGPLVIVLTALGLGAVWMFSRFFGLDMATGFGVLLRLLLLAVVACGCWKFGDDVPVIHPGKSWPLLLALFIVCWWPALDVWARHQSPRLWADEQVTLWWNAWYTKLAVLVAGVAGYVVNLSREE
jgi:hypothetical protein